MHNERPTIFESKYNAFNDSGNVGALLYPDKILLQVHGKSLYLTPMSMSSQIAINLQVLLC